MNGKQQQQQQQVNRNYYRPIRICMIKWLSLPIIRRENEQKQKNQQHRHSNTSDLTEKTRFNDLGNGHCRHTASHLSIFQFEWKQQQRSLIPRR